MQRWQVLGVFLLGASGCLEVLGTENLTPCTGDACDSGGAGGAGTGGAGDAGTGGTGGIVGGAGGAGCLVVTMTVAEGIIVLSADPELDFKHGTHEECLAPGSTIFTAVCDQGDNEDDPVAVTWGNTDCSGVGPTCELELQNPAKFTVNFASGASCP